MRKKLLKRQRIKRKRQRIKSNAAKGFDFGGAGLALLRFVSGRISNT